MYSSGSQIVENYIIMKKNLQGKRDWFILLVHRRAAPRTEGAEDKKERREKHKDKQKEICRKCCYKNHLLELNNAD